MIYSVVERRRRRLTAEEALNFIHEKLWQSTKPGLSRTRELLFGLGNPQNRLRFVHITGTNGKGSVAAMLSSVLTASGFRTGLYTSPYVSRFNERIQIDGEPISDEELAEITSLCVPLALSMEDRPTEFELVTAVAMEHFARRFCDVVVLEVGMGGRLDSTNVIEAPLCSVITNIGLDHTRELGDTAQKIALEKAGIIKEGCPVITYELERLVDEVIADECLRHGSSLSRAQFGKIVSVSDSRSGQVFSYKEYENVFLPLLGEHQLKNAAVALETVDVLNAKHDFGISKDAVLRGFSAVKWPARFEILAEAPYFVVDGGHNPQCAETVADNLKRYFPGMNTVILLGVLADKDYMSLAGILSNAADSFVTITPKSPRALSAEVLAKEIEVFGKPVFSSDIIEDGVSKAIELAGKDGVVCSVGSLYTAGTVRAFFGR